MRRMTIVLLLLLTAATAFAAPQATTIILVRHAEKAAPNELMAKASDDVPLSDAGFVRAKELARVLGSVHLDAIYTSDTQRTKQTAEPVAKEKGLTPVVMAIGDRYAADVAERILAKNLGQTALVVSHSNRIPDILRALGVFNPPAIADKQFDDLFVCTIVPGGEAKLLTLRYGAAAR